MGKISGNGGVYMTIITSDMILSKKTSRLLLTVPIKIIRLYLPEQGQTELDIQVDVKTNFPMFFLNAGWKSKILKVKSAVMKSYLHVLVVLAINANIAGALYRM